MTAIGDVDRALLDAIAAAPDDDAPRLVYADHLATRDEPRAELVHLQCRLAAIAADDPQRAAIADRVTYLLEAHAPAFLGELIPLAVGARFAFRRGFVEEMSGRFASATTNGAQLAVLAPLLTDLHLSVHGQRDRVHLARPPDAALLARARALSITGRHAGETRDFRGPIADLAGLAALPWRRLRSLRLATLRIDAAQLVALLAAPALASVERFSLRARMPSADLVRVAESLAGGLRSVELTGSGADTRVVAALASSPAAAQLTELVIDRAQLPASALVHLSPHRFPRLRRLSLATNPIEDGLRAELAAWPGLDELIL